MKKTVKTQVLSLLKRKWVDHNDINDAVYPHDGMRRVRELRTEGHLVAKRFNETTGTYQYKVVPKVTK